MAVVLFHYSKVVRNFVKNANFPRISAEQLLEKGINYDTKWKYCATIVGFPTRFDSAIPRHRYDIAEAQVRGRQDA
jgi:hypothetical protein